MCHAAAIFSIAHTTVVVDVTDDDIVIGDDACC